MRALCAGATCYVPKKNLDRDLVRTLQRVLALVDGHRPRQRLLACQTSRSASYEIENDPQLIAPMIVSLQEDMLAFGIGDETARMRAGIALHESLANALYHGNLECSSDLRQDDEVSSTDRPSSGVGSTRIAPAASTSSRASTAAEPGSRSAIKGQGSTSPRSTSRSTPTT